MVIFSYDIKYDSLNLRNDQNNTFLLFRTEYSQLSIKYKPVNLGQGFPDFCAPENITKALAAATTSSNPLLNQYTRAFVS